MFHVICLELGGYMSRKNNRVPGLRSNGRIDPRKIQTRAELLKTLDYLQKSFHEDGRYILSFDKRSVIFTERGSGSSYKITIPPGGFNGPCPAEFLRHGILSTYNLILRSRNEIDNKKDRYPVPGQMIDISRIEGYERFVEPLKVNGYGLVRGEEPDTFIFFRNSEELIPVPLHLVMGIIE